MTSLSQGEGRIGGALVDILAHENDGVMSRDDQVAVEEALEIRLAGVEPVITMRTPGNDRELAAGLMLSEGVVRHPRDFQTLCTLVDQPDVIQIQLRRPSGEKTALLERSSLSTSACGVCGKKKLNLESMQGLPPLSPGPWMTREQLGSLAARMQEHQALFACTGGLHGAALFDARGEMLAIREDVGRHNALDKLLGWALLNDRLPLDDHAVMLSGRVSFELMQKCIMARVPLVCAVSAPSSYAVRLAREFGVTLVGFLRASRFNVYAQAQRISDADNPSGSG
ncbi:formate dehydrogenase accessory sulfurtransferase FdhD [Pistricoccus aurantiacus]|uniref:Sulfur carrier protein FdhD n=1 Tax=Pistricoccus aurantiacus TaxID=1883414 RepID=A0A5B8SR41_9GAMM|nr:formate dehydrogenase accessory sulfurtransferase FdhD [Pistricoccus aurantiacus]QEA39562.1 formate dehydrogenase accessory sulfurtransferase FdhD [Pistricoccus aurantiacus]